MPCPNQMHLIAHLKHSELKRVDVEKIRKKRKLAEAMG